MLQLVKVSKRCNFKFSANDVVSMSPFKNFPLASLVVLHSSSQGSVYSIQVFAYIENSDTVWKLLWKLLEDALTFGSSFIDHHFFSQNMSPLIILTNRSAFERERQRDKETERVEAKLKGLLGFLYDEKRRFCKILSLASSGDAGLLVGPLDG